MAPKVLVILLLSACAVYATQICHQNFDAAPAIEQSRVWNEKCLPLKAVGRKCVQHCKEFHSALDLPLCSSHNTPLPVCRSQCQRFSESCQMALDCSVYPETDCSIGPLADHEERVKNDTTYCCRGVMENYSFSIIPCSQFSSNTDFCLDMWGYDLQCDNLECCFLRMFYDMIRQGRDISGCTYDKSTNQINGPCPLFCVNKLGQKVWCNEFSNGQDRCYEVDYQYAGHTAQDCQQTTSDADNMAFQLFN